ncbi:MAG: nucleoside recognition domain-containing protein [Gammaproteobacteria bacterium]|nr:MAG: nucleoside recognition domain-containing protein [Gammaproteobacteria bacterium]
MNYIWGGLIITSALFALFSDLGAELGNRYRNGERHELRITPITQPQPASADVVQLTIPGHSDAISARMAAKSEPPVLQLLPDQPVPAHWRTIAGLLPDLGAGGLNLTVVAGPDDQGRVQVTLPEVHWVRMQAITQAAFDMAEFAVKLAIGLIGLMGLWLGMMKIAEASGLVAHLVRWVQPALRYIFPDIPRDHPALGAISLNLAANMLGMGNAATPMGIKAMHELSRLNEGTDQASDSMCMFLALNTSSVQLIPPITLLALLGAQAGGLFFSILITTSVSTLVAFVSARWFARRWRAKGQ